MSLTDDQLIALNTLRSVSLNRLYQLTGNPSLLTSTDWANARTRRQIKDRLNETSSVAQRERETAAGHGATIITKNSPDYPRSLLDLELPPPVLYVRGLVPDSCQRDPALAIGIVGSRRCGVYGREAARLFGREIAAAGVAVVSGMAVGVDGSAHRGSLETGGQTIAVLGCGIDVTYPRQHRSLAEQISTQGAVISQFPLNTPPLARNFPVRNHLIAALSQRVLIVRATFRSGSLITARLALDLGRDVFAVPGSIFDPKSQGCHALLSDGAGVAHQPRDLLDFIAPADLPRQQRLMLPREVDPKLWKALPPLGESTSVDELSETTHRRVDELLVELSRMELQGLVGRLPGDRFTRLCFPPNTQMG